MLPTFPKTHLLALIAALLMTSAVEAGVITTRSGDSIASLEANANLLAAAADAHGDQNDRVDVPDSDGNSGMSSSGQRKAVVVHLAATGDQYFSILDNSVERLCFPERRTSPVSICNSVLKVPIGLRVV